jgi:hypothetical protein
VIGQRIRVQIATNRGNTGVFIGNLAQISPETLVVEIPGGKGRTILPRAAIAEVAVADGRESRLKNLPVLTPLLAGPVMLATLPPPPGPHHNAFRNQRLVLLGMTALGIGRVIARTPGERWRPVYSWLDR